MKKVWKFIVKHRVYVVLLFFVIVLVFLGLALKAYLYPEDENTNYGSRLAGINEVLIDAKEKEDIVSFIKENETVKDASVRVQGKIININITTSTDKSTSLIMQAFCDEIITKFKEQEVAFYDFQFFVKNEDANYNMIGYKKNKNELISWTVDDIVSEEEVNEEEK